MEEVVRLESLLGSILASADRAKNAFAYLSEVDVALAEFGGINNPSVWISTLNRDCLYRPLFDSTVPFDSNIFRQKRFQSEDSSMIIAVFATVPQEFDAPIEAFVEKLSKKSAEIGQMSRHQMLAKTFEILSAATLKDLEFSLNFLKFSMNLSKLSVFMVSENCVSPFLTTPTQEEAETFQSIIVNLSPFEFLIDSPNVFFLSPPYLLHASTLNPPKAFLFPNLELLRSFIPSLISSANRILHDSPGQNIFAKELLSTTVPLRFVPSAKLAKKFDSFDFRPIDASYDRNISLIFYIASKFHLLQSFSITSGVLLNFIEEVRAQYNPNPYHNWIHSVCVLYYSYQLVSRSGIQFTPLELFSLFIACLCHDIGHIGKSNSYLQKVNNPYGILFQGLGVMEMYHCSKTIETLGGFNNIHPLLCNIKKEEIDTFWKIVIQLILSTNIGKHNEYMQKYSSITNDDHALVLTLFIDCADLSNPLNNYTDSNRWSGRVTEENVRVEEEEGTDKSPREKTEYRIFAKSQVWFSENFCVPLFGLTGDFLPRLKPLFSKLGDNIERWKFLAEKTD